MNKKIVGIIFCMLMIVTAFDVIGGVSNSENIFLNENRDKINSLFYKNSTWLLSTRWGQHDYYDDKTPTNPIGEHYRLGCWSVAIGQIMRYHELQSHGIVTYSGGNYTIWNNLDVFVYNWSYMPDYLNKYSLPEEVDNVSQILYDTATVIQKNWGTNHYFLNGSEKVEEIIDHFDYISSQSEYVINPPISEIVDEIDNLRPCMLYIENITSGGHAVVIDGYEFSNNDFFVHLNMGWNGNNNSFYDYDKPIDIYDNNSLRGLMFIRLSPRKPDKPAGPFFGKPGILYNFSTKSIARKDPIYYKWDWGDGTFSDWLGRYNSNETCVASHKWNEKKTYNIRVKAKNVDGWESPWSEELAIIIPRLKNIDIVDGQVFYKFDKFFDRFPNKFLILQKLLNILR